MAGILVLTSHSREAITQRIRDSVNIVDVIGAYVALRPAGANYRGLCPFHEEKTPSFHVHPGKQIFKCFGCGVGGDVFTFLQLREKVDFMQARAMLAERAGVPIEDDGPGPGGQPRKLDLARANRWAADLFRRQLLGPTGAAAREYITRRGIRPEWAEAFGLGFALDSFDALINAARRSGFSETTLAAAGLIRPNQRGAYYDTFRNRLMFPIIDPTDRVLGFGARTLADDPAKYLNTPETPLFEKRRELFGLNRARHAILQKGRAIVVEGYTDCLMAHQHGFDETVATLGTAFTDEQARLLRRFTDKVFLVFDSDAAGRQAADRALSVSLLQDLEVYVAAVPTGKDPCDYLLSAGPQAFADLLIQAPTALEFKWRQVAARFSQAETRPARRRAIEEFLAQIAGWTQAGAIDVIARGLLVNRLAKLLSMPASDIDARLKAMQKEVKRAGTIATTGSVQPREEQRTRTDPTQRALRELIEVLLNEPGLIDQVGNTLETHPIDDPVLAAIVPELVAWCRRGPDEEGWRLADLLGRFTDPAFGRALTDLQAAGERRGRQVKYSVTLAGALEGIAEADRIRAAAAATREVRSGGDREAESQALAVVTELARQHRGFHPLAYRAGRRRSPESEG